MQRSNGAKQVEAEMEAYIEAGAKQRPFLEDLGRSRLEKEKHLEKGKGLN